MNPSNTLSIGQVAAQAKVSTATLRYYEQLGLLVAPQRQSGQRRYLPSVVGRIKYIQIAQRAGFQLEEIKTLIYEFPLETRPSTRWQQLATTKLLEIEALIARAQEMKQILQLGMLCQCSTLADCEHNIAELQP